MEIYFPEDNDDVSSSCSSPSSSEQQQEILEFDPNEEEESTTNLEPNVYQVRFLLPASFFHCIKIVLVG